MAGPASVYVRLVFDVILSACSHHRTLLMLRAAVSMLSVFFSKKRRVLSAQYVFTALSSTRVTDTATLVPSALVAT